MPERLFRVIVRGWYAGAAEESKEEFLFGSGKIGPESLGGFEAKRLFADLVQFLDGVFSILAAAFRGYGRIPASAPPRRVVRLDP